MSFDEAINRYGHHAEKWDQMERLYGIPEGEGIAMWVADMDFRPPQAVQRALESVVDHGVYGYFGGYEEYNASVCWWMQNRHGWTIAPEAVLTTHGLVNGVGLILQAFTAPGDGVVLHVPVYHAFARTIRAAGREVVECGLASNPAGEGQRYTPDFAAWDAQMTGKEKMFILCSPHNPGGRVWTREELRGFADFCKRHDLILVSDEIHHDLIFPGHRHIPTAVAAPEIADRLITLAATSKTFNLAGGHTGNVIIEDEALRKRFVQTRMALGISPNMFGMHIVPAAYNAEGAAWVDELMLYLDGNRQLFDAAMNAIPGVASMPLEGTYLAWVDFRGTGMGHQELAERVVGRAKVAPSYGEAFGTGGQGFVRFNLGTTRANVAEAARRLQAAFADLQ